MTTTPVDLGNALLVGTELGVYVVSEGSIEQFIEMQPVRDISHVQGDLAIALVDDPDFANIKAVDISTGEVRWSHSQNRTVYSQDFGTIDRQVPVFDAEPIDGTTDIVVSAGSTVVALNGQTGDPSWKMSREYAVWQTASIDGTVYAGTQGGSVVAIDAASGELVYEKQVAEPFEHERFGSIPRSVWNVEPVTLDGSERLSVTTEDGTAALLEPDDGTLVWQKELVAFDEGALQEYYRQNSSSGVPTVPSDAHYFNLELTVAERDSGTSRLAIAVAIPQQPQGRRYDLQRRELYNLSADSGSVEWSKEGVSTGNLGNIAHSSAIQGGSLLVPSPGLETTQTIRVYSVEDGAEGTPIEVASAAGRNRRANERATGYVVPSGDRLVVASSNGDLKLVDESGDIEWSVLSLRNTQVLAEDFLGDGTDDYLVYSQNTLRDGQQHRNLMLRAGTDGTIAWSRLVDVERFLQEGGLTRLRPIENDDGGFDILAVQRRSREQVDRNQRPLSTLVHLSGSDGTELARYELVNDENHAFDGDGQRFRITSIDAIGDVTGNGTPDVLVGAGERVFVIDLQTGAVVWERLYRDVPPEADAKQWQPLDGNDIRYRAIGGDGELQAFVAVSREQGEVAVLQPATSNGELSFRTVTQAEVGQLNGNAEIRTIPDRNADGYDEVLFSARTDDGPQLKVFSPGDGQVVNSYPRPRTANVVPTDFENGEGLVTFSENEGQATVTVSDGFDQVWRRQMGHLRPIRNAGIQSPQPVTPIGDVDDDGNEEIAIVKSSRRSGAKVELYDVNAGETVDEIVLAPYEEVNRPPIPGIHAQPIPDQTGDGVPELGVVAVTDGNQSRTAEFYIVDPVEGEVLLSGRGAVTRFSVFEDRIGLIGSDGSLTTTDPSAGVSLAEPDSQSEQQLEWSFAADGEYVTTVRVNERLVARTTEQSTSVRLPSGEFTIQIESTDANGISVYDSRSVTVESDSSLDLAMYGLTALSVGAVFGLRPVSSLIQGVRR
ncbi:outer membrane protein assembly factor BamB family protein [Halorussus halobius]|uniref:outer membrane protein assembly factor BamB family protein n=1 Tax=Halorussus halobius TaxID=1710537 RepID=UPI00143D1D1A|nr:PQQ-binding-like beta-propeller repeat protein [Halorussus halobius]